MCLFGKHRRSFQMVPCFSVMFVDSSEFCVKLPFLSARSMENGAMYKQISNS